MAEHRGSQRKLVITQNITVDGRIEMLDDWFAPTEDDPEVAAENRRQSADCDAVLFGRQTFEDMRGFWPHQVDDRTGVTDYLNLVAKYVVSSSLGDPQWDNSIVLTGDWLSQVAALKQQPGDDIVCTGSITLCHALFEAGVVDELRLFRYPHLQGRGRGLLPENGRGLSLRPLRGMVFDSGVRFEAFACSSNQ